MGPGDRPSPQPHPAIVAAVLGVLLNLVGIFAGSVTGTALRVYQVCAVILSLATIWMLLIPRGRVRKLLTGLLAATAVATVSVAAFLPQIRELVNPSCDDPVELTVLLPVDGAFGFEESVGQFNEQYVDGSGCKRANVTAYSAQWPEVQKALRSGWEVDEELVPGDPLFGFAPQRDVGPRPDLWLAESAAQVELGEDLLSGTEADGVLDADEAAPVGSTPLVVAVPDQVFDAEFGVEGQIRDENLPDLVQRLGDQHGLSVVRSDPTLSYTALLFLEFLYGAEPDAVRIQIEKQLARSSEDAGFGLPGTDTGLICELAEVSSFGPGTAVLTTERALAQYNRGDPLGEDCPLKRGSRSGYAPVYLQGLGSLDYRTARLHWEDPWAERRSAVAEDLTDWLAGEDEAWSPEQIGIRGNGYDGGELDGELDFALGFEALGERLTGNELEDLLNSYSSSRVPTNVLLAIDGSMTMGTQISSEGRSRFELATEGVRAALEKLSPNDAVGLWTFPAEGDASHDALLKIETGRSPQDADLLVDHPLVRGVDLHQTLVEGVDALEEAAGEDSVEAMVVLTDGADLDDSAVGIDDVIDHVSSSEVSLYIIAVGDASCRAGNFAGITGNPRISCLEAEEDRITTTFDSLFGQLWS